MAGLMLGTLSVTLGVFLFCVAVASVAGYPWEGWLVAAQSFEVTKGVATTAYLPSEEGLASILIGLGMAATGLSRRRTSPLAVVAIPLLLLALFLPVARFLVLMAYSWIQRSCL
jgi:hypothetical protein